MDRVEDLDETGSGFKPHAELLLKKDLEAKSNYDYILFDLLDLVGKMSDFSLYSYPKEEQ